MTVRVLLIGGTDSSGGAGLARDIATVAGMGAETCVAVTAVTAQTDACVSAVQMMSPELVAEQVKGASGVDAVKIGMLGSAQIVSAVAQSLPAAPLVLDPVLASTSGRALLDGAGMEALLTDLLPRTTLLTPNLPELRMLSSRLGLKDECDEATCAEALMTRGCRAVLVKGGHDEAETFCEDRLYIQTEKRQIFRGPRYGFSLRGTGCQMASAIAVTLGQGGDLRRAVSKARSLVMTRFRHEL
ncbi:bifunctional hydroxymethylpyrimidine kinase/phosphomethylpyrimidine kinase [Celeribacter sp. SCSIO 80788]|uniref:bifunctional hydroxymethylpyrimidine kinase/phosphomethylpyrimidine kinase n=1 Tax=Celeribacter sp. SCSIO 80788 TaxID=3117013 RepID=UPI003DA684BB